MLRGKGTGATGEYNVGMAQASSLRSEYPLQACVSAHNALSFLPISCWLIFSLEAFPYTQIPPASLSHEALTFQRHVAYTSLNALGQCSHPALQLEPLFCLPPHFHPTPSGKHILIFPLKI